MVRPLLLCLMLAAAPLAASATVAPPPPPPRPPLPAEDTPYPPHGDALGQVWEQEEVSGWTGTWIRRGLSSVFDAYWSHPGGERVLAVLEVQGGGREVSIIRRHANGQSCHYRGHIAPGWREVTGHYTCSWESTPMPWRARIIRMRDVEPQILR